MPSAIDQYFFFSYARKDETNPPEDHEEMIFEFFEELCGKVRDLVNGGTPGLLSQDDPVGFIDRKLHLGSNYDQSLPDALQRCKCLVCLYSARYFTRMICGQEAQVFLDRVANDERKPETILPVLWEPAESLEIPGPMKSVQFSEQGFPYAYRQSGLRELMVKNKALEYRQVVLAMANWVIAANGFDLAPLPQAVDLKTHPRAFPEITFGNAAGIGQPGAPTGPMGPAPEGPRAVLFAYVSSFPPWAWTPFPPLQPPPPPADPIGTLAAGIALEKRFFPGVFNLAPGIPPKMFIDELARAKVNNTPVVLLVDPSTLQLSSYRSLLDAYDDVNFLNCAALVVWDASTLSGQERRVLEDLVGKVFDDNLARTSQFFLDDIRSAKDLSEKLPAVLEDLRTNVRSKGAPRRGVPGTGSAIPVL